MSWWKHDPELGAGVVAVGVVDAVVVVGGTQFDDFCQNCVMPITGPLWHV